VQYNYLKHSEVQAFLKELKDQCNGGSNDACVQQLIKKYHVISNQNDTIIAQCPTIECVTTLEADAEAGRKAAIAEIDDPLIRNRVTAWQFTADPQYGLGQQQIARINLSNEFLGFSKNFCGAQSVSQCAQKFTEYKSGTIGWLRDLKQLGHDGALGLADDPNQPAWKVFLGVTGMTLSTLMPTSYGELMLVLGPGVLSKWGNGANSAGRTGTVFDSIAATQPVYPGSAIPRSFEMALPNGQRVWVAGNATEHMAEFAQMKAVNYTPEAVRLASQQQLSSLQGAVNAATQNGITYNQVMTVGGWELKFSPPR